MPGTIPGAGDEEWTQQSPHHSGVDILEENENC